MSLMSRLLAMLGVQFQVRVVFFFVDFEEDKYLFTSFLLGLLCRLFERHLDYFVRGIFSPRVGPAQQRLAIVVKRLYGTHDFLCQYSGTGFLVLHFCIRFTTNKSCIGPITKVEVNNLFDNPSAAASMSKNLAIWASIVSSMTSLRSRSHISCSKTIYATDQTQLGVLCNVLHRKLSTASSIIATISFVINSFKVASTFRVMTSNFSFAVVFCRNALLFDIFRITSSGCRFYGLWWAFIIHPYFPCRYR